MRSVLTRPGTPAGEHDAPRRWLLPAGLGAFALALGLYVIYTVIHPKSFTMDPVDLAVYRSGGLIVRHVRPLYDSGLAAPLYDWVGYGKLHLPFTYTPFAAIAFAVISFVPWWLSQQLSVAVDILALLTALWLTLGGLGYRKDRTRLGLTLLAAAAVFWTEPVLRTMYLGQVNLVLMALIIWDLCQPDTEKSRWWKGFGTGVAAGIKLVPLIFIPYLLLARKFRQAAMACAGFAFTIVLGFAILPSDSRKWWFGGLFFQGGRTGFTGWAGNQSLDGLITRLTGSINGAKPAWIAAAVVVGAAGVTAAALLDRKGYPVAGLLTAALTGLLVSPISWDHHWVWIAPGALVAAHYAVQAWRRHAVRPAVALTALAVAIPLWFGAWPARLFTAKLHLGNDSLGLLWIPPNTNPVYYQWYGDRPGFTEYHWHLLAMIAGNAYILAGLALAALLLALALLLPHPTKEHHDEPGRAQGSLRGRLRLPAA
ncbi:MAG TPA: glycosyltransferase 87 family protein [Streptosporangiaceae bacterium]|nr:glycosyltransferase 87 family protein [Streptosporangiaceae bacterium]